MKLTLFTFHFLLFTCGLFAQATISTGDFLFQKKAATGPYVIVPITPVANKYLGFDGSGNLVLKTGGGGGGSSDWADITSKPTTLAGYGITDAAPINAPGFTGDVTMDSFTSDGGLIASNGSGTLTVTNLISPGALSFDAGAVSSDGAGILSVVRLNAVGNSITLTSNGNLGVMQASAGLSGTRTWTFPDATGTVALAGDVISTAAGGFGQSVAASTGIPSFATGTLSFLTASSASSTGTLVQRDSFGNFSAQTITASLTGNASTASALNFGRTIGMTGDVVWTSGSFTGSGNVTGTSTIGAGKVTNAMLAGSIDLASKVTGILPNANTTAASANTASAIVTRDGSGNFSAGTITAALTGTASGNPTASSTDSLTNKRITARVTTITSSGTPTINTDACDLVNITALAADVTSMTSSLSGSPIIGDQLLFFIKDNGTARALTWGASFEACGSALPTTTVTSKRLRALFIYDSSTSKWGCVSTSQEQ